MSTSKPTLTRNPAFAEDDDYFAIDLVRLHQVLAARSPSLAERLDATLRKEPVDADEFFELLVIAAGQKVVE